MTQALGLDVVLARFEGVRRSGSDRAMARCPAHDDKKASLSVARGDGGRVLLKCHAGCSFEAICEAAGFRPAELCGGSQPHEAPPRGGSRGFVSAEAAIGWMERKLIAKADEQYVYYARGGGEVFRIVRFDPKTFRPLHQQRNGRWRFKDPPGKLPLYRLDKLSARSDETVLLVEGERCVHVAEQLGALATTSAHGSKMPPDKSDWSPMASRDVVIWPDADDPGACYADLVATVMTQLDPPATVRTIAPVYELGKGADLCDWRQTGGTPEQLAGLIAEAPPWRQTRAVISVTGQLREVSENALAAIEAANDPPILFTRNASIVRVRVDENGRPLIGAVGIDELRHRAARAASFIRVRGTTIRDVPPPHDVVRDILAAETMWPFPPIVGVTEVPVLRPDGSVLDVPGYDAQTRLVYVPDPRLEIPKIPSKPTRKDAERAVQFILDEVMADFPFVRDGALDGESASRTNMLATLLTPVMRPFIDGPTPLAVIDAPTAGSGKGLLASVTALIASGRPAALFSAPVREEEWVKQITSSLLGGITVLVIDNVIRTINSPSLAAALTAGIWDARVLGISKNANVPVRVTWLATGNNVRLGADMPRRAYWVRVDPEMPSPWERDDFRHPDLLKWIAEHRGEIVAALLTMARAWCVAGAPHSDRRLGSFETWRQSVGGTLEFAGAAGFLTNRAEMLAKADDDAPQWRAFLSACSREFGSDPFTVHDLTTKLGSDLDDNNDLKSALPDHLADALTDKAKSFTRRLGKALSSIEGRRFDETGLHVERISRDAKANVQRWRVVRNPRAANVSPAVATADVLT